MQPLVAISLAVAGDFSTGEDVAQTVRSAHGQPGVIALDLRNAARESGSGAGTQGDGIREGGPSYGLSATMRAIPGVAIHENQRGEITTPDKAGALNTGGGKPGQGYPVVMQSTVVRRLTELECERLQGFPDGWTDEQSGAARYRQLGNAVAVPVVEWIARRLIEVDGEIHP